MQNLEDVAMYTHDQLHEVEFIYPGRIDLDNFVLQTPLEPFSDGNIDFLNTLSSLLNKSELIRAFPDIGTFAFFCRKANVLLKQKRYQSLETLRIGRGIVFHITPSNVPVNFAYSFVAGLLAGNSNIVRVPTSPFKQTEIICEAISSLSEKPEFKAISQTQAFVRYDRKSTATALFSSICDVRVIWGGDNSIEEIRKNPIPPRSFDLTFADRYSICAINADCFVTGKDADKVISGFYNDTFLFDQNACSSPHLIIWTGQNENIESAKEYFWNRLHYIVTKQYNMQPVVSIDKLTSFFTQAVALNNSRKIQMPDNLIWRIKVDKMPDNIEDYRCNSGFFYEYDAKSLDEIAGIVNRKYQTLAYYGYNKEYLADLFRHLRLTGIDRIVPIGRTTDFSFTWDGYDLIKTLSRECDLI